MVTEKEAFDAKKLAAKYGVIGKVAGRYRMAGYLIDMIDTGEGAAINFLAYKRGEKLAVKVYTKSGHVEASLVEKLASNAKDRESRGVLVLYGSGPKITGELVEKARELGISIRRMRP